MAAELKTGACQFPQDSPRARLSPNEIEVFEPCRFMDRIGRPELREVITSQEPWVYTSAEFYGQGIKGQGGLGMLAGDTFSIAVKLNLPMIFLTPFYRWERSYELDKSGRQQEVYEEVTPERRGFKRTDINEFVSTSVDPVVALDFYEKKVGSVTLLTPTEKNIGELYEGCPESDRRLYQNVAFCFGGYKALKGLGKKPSMNQLLNEAPAVFFGLARLDDYMSETKSSLGKAISEVRKKTIFTNHTLVPAAEPTINLDQFRHFVMPNIRNSELNEWLFQKIRGKGNQIKLSTLAFELSEKKNGVSKIHAREASKSYKDYDGKEVKFESVTNGIAIDRWGSKELLDLYRKKNVLDTYDLPNIENIKLLGESELLVQKEKDKTELRSYLKQRKDQEGKPVIIPEGAKIVDWRRRLANYKRPGMIFERPDELASILENENIHFVMAGNVHPADDLMKVELERILNIVSKNKILKERFHFIQDYDEDLGRALAQGADVSINTPRVGEEACGTSGMKDMVNNVIVISTEDGWLADPAIKARSDGQSNFVPSYLQICGQDYGDEVSSLYSNLSKAAQIIDGRAEISWGDFVKRQLVTFLPIISGSRMEEDYIKLGFPVKENVIYAA